MAYVDTPVRRSSGITASACLDRLRFHLQSAGQICSVSPRYALPRRGRGRARALRRWPVGGLRLHARRAPPLGRRRA
eukprot:14421897-Alexandrium_andersonii.AAC.1